MFKTSTIFIPFFVSMFWMVFFLLNWKRYSRSQHIWTVAMGLITISMGIAAYYWQDNKDYSLYYKLDIIDSLTTLSFVPVIFLYFREVTGDKSKMGSKMALLLLSPPILAGIIVSIVYLQMGNEQATSFMKSLIENQEYIVYDNSKVCTQIYKIANAYGYTSSLLAQVTIVIIYATHRLLFYRKQLDDFFSNIDDKSMEHHWAVLWGLIALLILTLGIGVSGYLLFIQYDIWVSVALTTTGVILYYICYHVSQAHYTAQNFALELINTEDEEVPEPDNDGGNHRLLNKFNQVIDEDRIFLQKNLRVDDVASLVCTNRTYISRIIKNEYNCNFWTFINHKRIGYAKEQVQKNPSLTIEALSEMCGFSHGTAFSRAFRQCEGITFREWQRNVLSQNPDEPQSL
ncbi:AraC family transcriptional regulator [Bacteroides sp. 519]|uniref:helix-turn-helix domain-containing protein n=1 Tax=Bacteroides sp. 519 TaxID=2302937 RepID=UPI0013D640C7|nr:AraC family transcriptional regulator [Bacteroides sp. 519]NDV59440.1 AraC family transcriptional regulator [Bacteroides sp. 519]